MSAIQNNMYSQASVPPSQNSASAVNESAASGTQIPEELSFDALFDWNKYDAEVPYESDSETNGLAPFLQTDGAADKPQIEPPAWRVTDVNAWKSEKGIENFLQWKGFVDLTTEASWKRLYGRARKVQRNASEYFVGLHQVFPHAPMLETQGDIVSPGQGVLTAIWKGNSDDEEEMEAQESDVELSSNSKSSGEGGKRRMPQSWAQRGGKKKPKPDYPTPSTSASSSDEEEEDDDSDDSEEEDDSDKDVKPSGRKGHLAGINRKTGKLTLVGTFPPDIIDGRFYCRDELCNQVNKGYDVTSKNGYKYHLKHVCLGNPNSLQALRRAAGFFDEKAGKVASFSQDCDDCGATFRSEAGYRKHREENLSTKNGKCSERRRRLEVGNSGPTAITLA